MNTEHNDKGPRDDRWYLNIMSPNTKGEKFAWLDPTSIYINGAAFHDLLDDFAAELEGTDIDVVAGLDAMGFVLGSALATRLGVGFLPIRKAGKLCVDTDKVSFGNYSGRTQDMEMRLPAFPPGTKVLLVDQWVETGGTMDGAIRLVERQKGVVAGMVAIAIEDNDRTRSYRQKYHCVSAVMPDSRWQTECNKQTLTSFDKYSAEMAFPKGTTSQETKDSPNNITAMTATSILFEMLSMMAENVAARAQLLPSTLPG